MFTLLCCADLRGEKVNLEVTLESPPVSLQDLAASLTPVFAREEVAMLARQGYAASAPTFQIANVFLYDDVLLHWTKLKSITQLHEYDQLYVFQPQTQRHRDTQQDLPPPRPPVQGRAASVAGAGGAALPIPVSSYVDNEPALSVGQSYGGIPPSVDLHGSANAQRAPADFGASTLSEAQRVASRSPVRSQLAEQRREEERLSQRLSSVRSERARLEREAKREEEEERRRRGAELDKLLRRKEEEIWAHRDALAKADGEFQRLLAEKQKLMGSASSP
ncbi:hypothetical protein ABB37_05052 [Leptomonas pyrrhocoris]|uniref:BILBO1 N-terminal domain-containing protein n=1 Tax=Leptomonas pyrrhocoris TaxID=157538 RepID=A0A0N0VFA6_LEPPY|nr:hypothetical protein ABB37_05052 [Leptomonas pyrrhocoris]KPA80032.1 hypothetical protein ABB37_05052 [Leptomonas pyrrhocoris]|eukprot:XP_015658471.1 hypothetical protein ABB37_05052 [Leptomonas pyrrhocoris]